MTPPEVPATGGIATAEPVAATGPILVIDDSLTIRKLLEMTLTRAGLPFELAGLGREGLALARRLRPRLILLDYVLPDVKGTEICEALDRDPLTAGLPVVVMSGKGDDIRDLFKARRAVIDVVAKPFSQAEILHVIHRALGRQPVAAPAVPPAHVNGAAGAESSASRHAVPVPAPAPVPAAATPARDPREAAARVLFAALRDKLARIPDWLAESPGLPPAPFLARRLLTPEVVGAVLTGLGPLGAPAIPAPAAEPPPVFAGTTGFLPLMQLLPLVAGLHRPGVLRLGGDDGVEAWFDRGDLVLAAPRDPAAAHRVLATAGLAEEPGRAAYWTVAARDAGVPPAVAAAAENGTLAADALRRIGRQALVQLAGRGPQPWRWEDREALPPAITLCARPLSIDQLALDRLRQVDDWSQVELDVRSLGQICERAPDLRQRLVRFELTGEESRVLLQVDGRRPVQQILERTGLSTFDVFHVLYRLVQVRLVRVLTPGQTVRRDGPVLLCAGGGVGGAERLSAGLARRSDAPRLITAGAAELVERILAESPRLVLVDVADPAAAARLAEAVRTRLEVSDTRLAAIAGRADRSEVGVLSAAGFDRVLAKPVHLNAIGRLLDG